MLNEQGSHVNGAAQRGVGPSDAARRAAESTLSRITRKWRLHVLWSITERPQRFNEILRTDDSLSSFMLSQALRDLEADGLVVREIVTHRPPFTAYRASTRGKELLETLTPLLIWAGMKPLPAAP